MDSGVAPLRPFVVCSFQGHTAKTDVKLGNNPSWNQILRLPMSAPAGDWSQASLVGMRDEISFSLWDATRKHARDEREANVETVRDEAHWLGGLTLPYLWTKSRRPLDCYYDGRWYLCTPNGVLLSLLARFQTHASYL